MRRPATLPSARIAVSALLTYVATSCGGGGTTEPPGPDSLAATGATTLSGFTGAQVGPLEVRLTDDDGDPRSGVNVNWAVTAGSGTLSAASTPTGADGRASVTWTLGPAAGTHTVTATVQGLGPITFTATVTFQTLEPTVNISMSGNHSVDRIIVPAGVTVTIVGPTTIEVDGEVQILGTLTGNCHALTIVGAGAGSISGTIANHCVAAGVGGDLEFTVDGPLSVTGTIRSAGSILIRNTPDIDEADLDAIFASPPRAAPALQVGGGDDCTLDGAQMLGAVADPEPAATGQDGDDAPDTTFICSGDSEIDGVDLEAVAEGQPGGAAPAPGAGPGPASGSGGNGGNGPDFTYYTNGNLTINPEGASILRLKRGGDGGDADVAASAPGQSAVAVGGNGGNGGGMRIGAGGGITIANTLTIVTGGGGHGGDARAVGMKGMDGDAGPSQPGGDATANGGNGGHTTEGRLRAQGAVAGTFNIELTDGGNYGDGGDGGDATAISGQGGNGGATDPNGAVGGDLVAGGGNGGDVRTQGFSGAFVGDAGDGGDITVGGAGGGSPAPQFSNVPPLLVPSMGGEGVDKCDPPAKGGNGGNGGNVLSNAAQSEPSQPGDGGEGGPGVTSDGDDGSIEVLDETGVGGDGGDGNPVGTGGGAGDPGGLGGGFARVNGSPIFVPGSDGNPCPLPNTPPTLQDASGSTPKNTPANGTLVYSDAEGDLPNPTSATVNNLMPVGAATVTNFQIVTIPGTPPGLGLRFTFTPATDFVGTVTFQVAVSDVRGALSNVVTVTVVVTDTSIIDARLEFSAPFEAGNTYTRQVTNSGTGAAIGTMDYGAMGTAGQFFTGVGPDRHGMVGSAINKMIFFLSTLGITADPDAVLRAVRFCIANSSGVGPGNPVTFTFFGPSATPPREGGASLGPALFPPPTQLTGNGCTPWILPGDAESVEMTLQSGVVDVTEPDLKIEVANQAAG